jgi:hypothetical protein
MSDEANYLIWTIVKLIAIREQLLEYCRAQKSILIAAAQNGIFYFEEQFIKIARCILNIKLDGRD